MSPINPSYVYCSSCVTLHSGGNFVSLSVSPPDTLVYGVEVAKHAIQMLIHGTPFYSFLVPNAAAIFCQATSAEIIEYSCDMKIRRF